MSRWNGSMEMKQHCEDHTVGIVDYHSNHLPFYTTITSPSCSPDATVLYALPSMLLSHPHCPPVHTPSHPSCLPNYHNMLKFQLVQDLLKDRNWNHAIVLSPCYHLISMLHCHRTVLSPPATISSQCYNVTQKFCSQAMLLSHPHCPPIHALSYPCCLPTHTPT